MELHEIVEGPEQFLKLGKFKTEEFVRYRTRPRAAPSSNVIGRRNAPAAGVACAVDGGPAAELPVGASGEEEAVHGTNDGNLQVNYMLNEEVINPKSPEGPRKPQVNFREREEQKWSAIRQPTCNGTLQASGTRVKMLREFKEAEAKVYQGQIDTFQGDCPRCGTLHCSSSGTVTVHVLTPQYVHALQVPIWTCGVCRKHCDSDSNEHVFSIPPWEFSCFQGSAVVGYNFAHKYGNLGVHRLVYSYDFLRLFHLLRKSSPHLAIEAMAKTVATLYRENGEALPVKPDTLRKSLGKVLEEFSILQALLNSPSTHDAHELMDVAATCLACQGIDEHAKQVFMRQVLSLPSDIAYQMANAAQPHGAGSGATAAALAVSALDLQDLVFKDVIIARPSGVELGHAFLVNFGGDSRAGMGMIHGRQLEPGEYSFCKFFLSKNVSLEDATRLPASLEDSGPSNLFEAAVCVNTPFAVKGLTVSREGRLPESTVYAASELVEFIKSMNYQPSNEVVKCGFDGVLQDFETEGNANAAVDGTGGLVDASLAGADLEMLDAENPAIAAPTGAGDHSTINEGAATQVEVDALGAAPMDHNISPEQLAESYVIELQKALKTVQFVHSVYFDACFGIPHLRRAASATHREPAFRHKVLPPRDVEKFVARPEAGLRGDDVSQCADFQADTALGRTSEKYDVTGVGGCFCPHGALLCLYDLTTGERWAYSTFGLNYLMAQGVFPLFWWYDINCRYRPHVQKWAAEAERQGNLHPGLAFFVKNIMRFPVPTWHHHAHNAACQAQNSYATMEDAGRGAGEPPEQGWHILLQGSLLLQYCSRAQRSIYLEQRIFDLNSRKEDGLLVQLVRSYFAAKLHMKRAEKDFSAVNEALVQIVGTQEAAAQVLTQAGPLLPVFSTTEMHWKAEFVEALMQIRTISATAAASEVPADILLGSSNPAKLKENGIVYKRAVKCVERLKAEHPSETTAEGVAAQWEPQQSLHDEGVFLLACYRFQELQSVVENLCYLYVLLQLAFKDVHTRRNDTRRMTDVRNGHLKKVRTKLRELSNWCRQLLAVLQRRPSLATGDANGDVISQAQKTMELVKIKERDGTLSFDDLMTEVKKGNFPWAGVSNNLASTEKLRIAGQRALDECARAHEQMVMVLNEAKGVAVACQQRCGVLSAALCRYKEREAILEQESSISPISFNESDNCPPEIWELGKAAVAKQQEKLRIGGHIAWLEATIGKYSKIERAAKALHAELQSHSLSIDTCGDLNAQNFVPALNLALSDDAVVGLDGVIALLEEDEEDLEVGEGDELEGDELDGDDFDGDDLDGDDLDSEN